MQSVIGYRPRFKQFGHLGLRGALSLTEGVGGIRPATRNVAFFGDSRTIQALYAGPRYGVRSYPYWMRLYTNQSFDTTSALNFGVSSDTTAQMAARVGAAVADMLAADVGTVVFLGGTNDSVNIATSSADIDYCLAAFRTAGIIVLLVTETPRDTAITLHTAIRDYCRTLNDPSGGIYTVDVWPTLSDGDEALTGVTVDGTHLSVYGCRILGAALATKLNTLMPQRDILPTANESSNAAGLNILTNAMLTGTGGTATNLESGSVVAASSSLNNQTTGALVTGSIGSRNGYNTQRIQITGTPTAASPYVRFEQSVDAKLAAALAAGIFQSGDVVDGGCYIRIADGTAGVKAVEVTLIVTSSNPADGTRDATLNTAVYSLDSGASEGVTRVIPRVLPSDATNLRIRVEAIGIQSVPMTFDGEIGRLFLKSLT